MNCENIQQCCAVGFNNKRCKNAVISGSSHCTEHRVKAVKLYMTYKKLSKKVEEIDLTKQFDNIDEHIKYINDSYVLIKNTHNARYEHQKYAYVPELYNEGHMYQIKRLKNLMDECEIILSKLYEKLMPEEEIIEEINDIKEKDNKNVTENKVNKKINKRDKKYIKDEETKDIHMWINKYIKENEIILENRKMLIKYIAKYIYELFDEDEDVDLFVKCVTMLNLTLLLHDIGYFKSSNFFASYDHCKDINCECHRVRHDVLLGCSCIYKCNSYYDYFNLLSEDTIKKFYEILLIHKKKILPFTKDILRLHNIFGDDIMFLRAQFVWVPGKKRLVLQANLSPPPLKMSKLFALGRVKNNLR